ncbi:MAG: aldo/keto reductase [Pontimonas sp.]
MDLILGTAQLTRPYGILQAGAAASGSPQEVLYTARDCGFVGVDTAPIYGEAEKVIGEAQTGLEIHTKIDPALDGVASIVQSRERLGVERLGVVYLHEVFDGSRHQLDTLERIRDEASGFVESLGVSIYTRRELEMAVDAEVVRAIQLPLNVATSDFTESDFREAQSAGKRVYARSIFLQGVLTAAPAHLPPAVVGLQGFVREFHLLAEKWEMSPVQAAIAFVKSQEGLSGIVVGADSTNSVIEVAKAFRLSSDSRFIDECREMRRPDSRATDPRNW